MLHVHESEIRTLLGEHLSNETHHGQTVKGTGSDDPIGKLPSHDDSYAENHYETNIACGYISFTHTSRYVDILHGTTLA